MNNIILKNAIIINELGMHARPAVKIAKIAARAVSGVWLTKDGEAVDATSIIDILTLGCAKGDSIGVKIDNPADTDILNRITGLIENGFEE